MHFIQSSTRCRCITIAVQVSLGALALLNTASVLATAAPRAPAPAHSPPSHSRPRDCEHWIGNSSGNATFNVSTTLCTVGDSTTGTIRFFDGAGSSTVRAYTGTWTSQHTRMALHQTAVVSSVESPAWRQSGFRWCTTPTVYAFRRVDGTHMEGTYDSPDCDRGTIALTAVGSR